MVSGRTTMLQSANLDIFTLQNNLAEMDLPELCSFAESNVESRESIFDVVKERLQLHDKIVSIDRMRSHDKLNLSWSFDSERITLRDYSLALKVLQVFGSLVTRIEVVGFNFDTTETAEIYRHINSYCSDSLIDITIEPNSADASAGFTETFEKVQNVKIHQSHILQQWSLHETFPKMLSLEVRMSRLEYNSWPNIAALQVKFPHLKHLSLYVAMRNTEFPKLREILRMNRQLESLSLKNAISADLMQHINTVLPELKNLDVTSFPDDFLSSSLPIHFKSLRTLSLTIRNDNFPKALPISFDRLELLHLKSHELYEPFVQLIEQITNLKRIEFEQIQPSDQQLQEIIVRLPALEELSAPLEDNISGNGISRLLTRKFHGAQLKKITVGLTHTQNRADLLKMVSSDWQLEDDQFNQSTYLHELTFKRTRNLLRLW